MDNWLAELVGLGACSTLRMQKTGSSGAENCKLRGLLNAQRMQKTGVITVTACDATESRFGAGASSVAIHEAVITESLQTHKCYPFFDGFPLEVCTLREPMIRATHRASTSILGLMRVRGVAQRLRICVRSKRRRVPWCLLRSSSRISRRGWLLLNGYVAKDSVVRGSGLCGYETINIFDCNLSFLVLSDVIGHISPSLSETIW